MIVYTDPEMAKILWPEIAIREGDKIDSSVWILDSVVYIEPDRIWANRKAGIYVQDFSVDRKRELRMKITAVDEAVMGGIK